MSDGTPMSGSDSPPPREKLIADTFVMLADTLVADYDVVDLLSQLVSACVTLVGVTAAGLLLDDQRGNLAVVASSSEDSRLMEVFQLQADEGPCLECARTGQPVIVEDLARESSRWPSFVPAALRPGFRSVVALPLRLRDQTIGGLGLFDTRVRELPVPDRQLAQALADVATIGILHRRTMHRSSLLAEQLQHALNSRITIEQAKGVLAERHGLGMEAAFATLQKHARDHNVRLTDLAGAVVRGETDPASLVPVAGLG